ncbi:Protein CBG00200 [Caenorhabditis briggsae]|uniref:Protein CBG00200 n=1 Tax=Caenorhabditis briggsae TaxID=6238 RepID=A8WMG5_CAEBR|nr:Protein CBG00200 [Caenorhabditis briggsae]CAP21670.2 Protein CBG00200 [Caenorhabditis briggsae]
MSQAISFVLLAGIVAGIGIVIASLVLNIIILGNVNDLTTTVNNNPVWHYSPAPQQNSSTGTVSNSAAYQQAANYLLNGLDDTIDPCQDFYAFTCNKASPVCLLNFEHRKFQFLQNTDLGKLGRSRLGTYDQAQIDVYTEIAAALDKIDVASTTTSKTERITKAVSILRFHHLQAFDTCRKNLFNPPDKSQVVYDEITALFGGVPFLGEKLNPKIDYWMVAGQIEQKHAVGTLTYTIASSDYKDHTKNALYTGPVSLKQKNGKIVRVFFQPGLSLARDFYVKPQYIAEVNARVTKVNSLLSAFAKNLKKTPGADVLLNAAQEVVAFEVLIAMASWPDDLLRNYQQQYNAYNIASATAAYSSINWASYLGQLFDGVATVKDQANYNIVVTEPSYFAWLNSVFAGQTSNQTVVANYMIAQLLADESDFISQDTARVASENNYIHYALRSGRGIGKHGKRDYRKMDLDGASQGCLDLLTAYMPYGTGYVYVKSKDQKYQVQSDVTNQTGLIISNFQNMINSLQWMDDFSKNRAHNKSDSLIKNFGWPTAMFGDFKDFTAVDQYNQDYASIIDIYTKDKSDIYGIFAVLKKGMESQQIGIFFNVCKKSNSIFRTNFLQSPAMVNAWYQPERNSITFPYAAWNPPYYNFAYPQAYNFAGQGGTGGHELTHGYDDEGVQFGFNGELTDCAWNKCGWMDTNSSSGFIDMAQCVVTQFSTQCCPEKTGNVHCANGATTQGENIADLGGQQAAYRAYRQYIAETRGGVEEDRLPGLEAYTPNQIFWITYGYSWCMKQSDANLVHQVCSFFICINLTIIFQLLTNPHSPAKCRTNQVMQDIPEFGKDFGCARGTPMYPEPANRCKVWVGQ